MEGSELLHEPLSEHGSFSLALSLNELDRLFGLIEKGDPETVRLVVSCASDSLCMANTEFDEFKNACRQVAAHVQEYTVVRIVVDDILRHLYHWGNDVQAENSRDFLARAAIHFGKKLATAGNSGVLSAHDHALEWLGDVDDKAEKAARAYRWFCTQVVRELLDDAP